MNSSNPQVTIPFFMTPFERKSGLTLMPVHMFLIPAILYLYAYAANLSSISISMVSFHYGISFSVIFFTMSGFLRRDLDALLDRSLASILTLLISMPVYLLFLYAAAFAVLIFVGEADAETMEAASYIAKNNFDTLFAFNVLVLPLVEEVLYRGVVFGSLIRKSRLLAYTVSIILYIIGNMWMDLVFAFDWTLLPLALQYVPLGFVCAYCYECSGTIWTSIIFHTLANAALVLIQVL